MMGSASLKNVDPLNDVPESVLEEAITWQVRLLSGTATHDAFEACEKWCATHDDHRRAWMALQQLDARFTTVSNDPSALAKHTLLAAQKQSYVSRRDTLKLLLLGGAIIPLGSVGWHMSSQPEFVAATGKKQSFTLADGSLFTLNSRSAADARLLASSTHVRLKRGDLYLDTRQQHQSVLATHVQADGWHMTLARGEYVIHHRDEQLFVHAIEGEMAVTHDHWGARTVIGGDSPWWIHTQSAVGWQPYQDSRFDPVAWLNDALVAKQMPLSHFLSELSCYREGWIRCAPEVRNVLVSGVFQVTDTDLAFQALEQTLPVKVRAFTPYLMSVVPA